MSQKGRKERVQDLYFKILDATEKGILEEKDFRSLKAKFLLEHGLSERTFFEYVRMLEQVGFMSQNVPTFEQVCDATTFEEERKLYYWKVSEGKKLPWIEL